MAAAGGHWVKGSSGPFAGKMNFVPAQTATTFNFGGKDYTAVKMGHLMAVQLGADFANNAGKWQIIKIGPDGKPGPIEGQAVYSTKNLATAKMANMQAAGFTKALNTPDGGLAQAKIAKAATTKSLKVTEPGAKNIKAETAAAQAQAKAAAPVKAKPTTTAKDYSTQADFDANKGPITVTTAYYKNKIEVEGVMVGEKGEYAVTYNQHTGKYHVVEMAGGTTVSTHGNASEAFTVAKTAAKSNQPAAANPAFKDCETIYGNTSQANAVFAKHFAPQYNQLSSTEVSALSKYQDSHYDTINGNLWGPKPQITPQIKAIDAAMKKSPGLPHDTILYRKKGTGTELYNWAQTHGVGAVYASKGFDSTSISTSGWAGNVTLVYRAPKGLKGFFMNTAGYNSSHPGEYEFLLPRNQAWNVIGKTQAGSNITLTLEYAGEF